MLFPPPSKRRVVMPRPHRVVRLAAAATLIIGSAAGLVATTGCHDGPLYALKVANPFFSLKEWRADEQIGVTDHVRRGQLQKLAKQIPGMTPAEQSKWVPHLQKIYENDANAEMRRLTLVAAAGLADESIAAELIGRGLDDSVAKVRMEACRSLGKRKGEDAARTLVATLNTDADLDVRHSAIAALANHPTEIAAASLKRILKDQDPATRSLAMSTLRQTTGQNVGNDPEQWIALLDKTDNPEAAAGPATQIATRPR